MYRKDVLLFKQDYTIDAIFHVKLEHILYEFTEYSSVLNTSHVATIWNFDPNYSLPNVTQVSLPKMFQIVATWLVFSTEEYLWS